MAPTELREARDRLGLTQEELAGLLALGSGGNRTVRRWETGERAIPGPVVVAMRLMAGQTRAALLRERLAKEDET
jgi:DNA-binding transcriptional regulator YiaG